MWADGRVKEKGRAQGRAGYGEGVARGRGGHGGGWRRKVMGGEGQETNTGPSTTSPTATIGLPVVKSNDNIVSVVYGYSHAHAPCVGTHLNSTLLSVIFH